MCGGDSRFPKRPDYHAREHSQSCGCARFRAMLCLDSTACNVHDGASRRHAHIVQHTAAQAHSSARVTAHDRTWRLLAVHCAACAPCVVSCCSSQASMTSCRRSTIIPGIIAQVQNSPGFLRRTKMTPKASTRFLTLGRRPKAIYTLTGSGVISGHLELTPPAGLHPSRVPWPPNGAHERGATHTEHPTSARGTVPTIS